jgi:hypothetical protein
MRRATLTISLGLVIVRKKPEERARYEADVEIPATRRMS